MLNRRLFLVAGAGAVASGCSTFRSPQHAAFLHPTPLAALRISSERLVRITVCTRPFRPAGPRLEAEAVGGNPTLESILAAFLKPPFEMCHRQNGGGAVIVRLFGRTYTEPGDELWKLFIGQFREVLERFGSALSRALPELPRRELFWRMHFMVATLIQTLADMRRLEMISGGECDPTDFDAAVERLVPFLAAGLRAPLPAGAIGGKGTDLT